MAGFVKGEVVVLNFPFSDLSGTKRRPAIVIASLDGDDLILSQITSRNRVDKYAIELNKSDFSSGKLSIDSLIRPNKIFTADENLILYSVGHVTKSKIAELEKTLVKIITNK